MPAQQDWPRVTQDERHQGSFIAAEPLQFSDNLETQHVMLSRTVFLAPVKYSF